MTAHTFIQPRPTKASEPAPTLDERLTTLENTIVSLAEGCLELTQAVEGHSKVLEILSRIPGQVGEAMKVFGEDQSKVNLTLTAKIDMNRNLITDLQDTIEDLRGEVADLDDDPIEMDNLLPSDPIFTTPEGITYPFPLDLVVTPTDVSRVYPEGEYVVVALPAPLNVEGMTMAAFDDALFEIVADADLQGYLSNELAEVLTSGISGELTYEEARDVMPKEGVPGITEALKEWWELGEASELNIHKDANITNAIAHVVAQACLMGSMHEVALALVSAFHEE